MATEAHKRVGHLYPPITITPEMGRERPDLKPLDGQKFTVIAWLWARTVKSTNPAFSEVDVPLASTYEMAHLYRHIEDVLKEIEFRDRTGFLMARIRRLFNRAQVDQNELNILRGILTAVQARRRVAGSPPGQKSGTDR